MINKKCDIGNSEIEFEHGKLAIQAPGSVVVKSGETMVLVTAVANQGVREGIDFFPLTVDVEERMYSAGKIPGGFFRREGRPTENGILTARLIDRPLRPSFSDGFMSETQIIVTVLSVDNQNHYDILALNGASLALQLAGIPLETPVGAVRMSLINDDWVAQATSDEQIDAVFEMVVAGKSNKDGNIDIVMVEAGATEDSLNLINDGGTVPDENVVVNGLELSKDYIGKLIETQIEMVKSCTIPEVDWTFVEDYSKELKNKIEEEYINDISLVVEEQDPNIRSKSQKELLSTVTEKFNTDEIDLQKSIKSAFNSIVKEVVRKNVVEKGIRLDGRKPY